MKEGSIETRIARFLLKYRTTPHSTTGVSPSQLLMGRRLTTALDRMIPDVASRVHDRQLNQKAGHDRSTKQRTFVAGEEVGAKNFTSATPKWLRGKIVRCRGPVSYDIELEDQRVLRRHADHIRKNTLPRNEFDRTTSDSAGEIDIGSDTSTESPIGAGSGGGGGQGGGRPPIQKVGGQNVFLPPPPKKKGEEVERKNTIYKLNLLILTFKN